MESEPEKDKSRDGDSDVELPSDNSRSIFSATDGGTLRINCSSIEHTLCTHEKNGLRRTFQKMIYK